MAPCFTLFAGRPCFTLFCHGLGLALLHTFGHGLGWTLLHTFCHGLGSIDDRAIDEFAVAPDRTLTCRSGELHTPGGAVAGARQRSRPFRNQSVETRQRSEHGSGGGLAAT